MQSAQQTRRLMWNWFMGFLSLNVTNHATITELALKKKNSWLGQDPHEQPGNGGFEESSSLRKENFWKQAPHESRSSQGTDLREGPSKWKVQFREVVGVGVGRSLQSEFRPLRRGLMHNLQWRAYLLYLLGDHENKNKQLEFETVKEKIR